MRIDEIELAAAHDKPPPVNMTAPESCLYTTLRALYNSYKRKELSRESASAEKKKILARCGSYDKEYTAWTAAAKYYQANVRKASTLLSSIDKADSFKAAAWYAFEAISAMTGDHGELVKRMKNKYQEEAL